MKQFRTLCSCALIAASTVAATAADPVETLAYYSTNLDTPGVYIKREGTSTSEIFVK